MLSSLFPWSDRGWLPGLHCPGHIHSSNMSHQVLMTDNCHFPVVQVAAWRQRNDLSKSRKGVVAGKSELFYSLPNLGARALKTPMTTAGTKFNIISPLTFSSSPVPALVSVTPSWGPTALRRLSLLCVIGISFINLSCSSLLGSSVLRDRSCPSISGKRHRLPKSCDMS